MSMRTLLIGLAVFLALTGCAAIPRDLQTPEVSFAGQLDVDFELAGEPFARGVSAREFVVPAQGEAEFDMNVTANAAPALLRIAGGDRKAREIDYRLKGKLSTRIGMLRTIPFEQTGNLPVSDLLGKKDKGN